MIHFIKFGYRGVGSFGNKWIEIPFGADLTQISGENGAGKSTLLECIFYAMYGEPFQRDTIGELVSWQNGKASFETGIWFSRNQVIYRIMRTLSNESLTRINDDGSETSVEGFSSKAGFQIEIDRLFGIDSDTARRILFISADDTKPFPELKANEKRAFIEDYFRLAILGKMEAIEKNRKSKMQSTVDIMSKGIDQSEPHIAYLETQVKREEATLAELEKQLAQNVTNAKLALGGALADNAGSLGFAEKTVAEVESKLTEANARQSEFLKIQEGLAKKAEDDATLLEEKMRTDIDTARQSNAHIDEQIVVETKAHTAEMDIKALAFDNEVNELKQTNVSNGSFVNEFLVKVTETEARLADMKTNLEAEKSFGGGLARLGAIDARIGQIKSEATTLFAKRTFLKDSLVCPECNSDITEEHRTMEIGKIANTVTTLRQEHTDLEAEAVTIREHLAIAKNIENDILVENLALRGFSTQLTTYQNAVKSFPNSLAQFNRNASSTLELKQSAFDARVRLEFTSKIVDVDAMTKIRQAEIDALKSKAESIRANALNTYSGIISKIESSLAVAKQTLEDTRLSNEKSVKRLMDAIDVATKAHESINRQSLDRVTIELTKARENHSQQTKELAEKQAELKVYEEGCLILGDKGVKPYFIKSFVPVLNKKVADMLKCFSLPVHIEFDEQLNMKMLNLRSPKEVKYRQHSKGERRRITTAILLSFIEIVSEKMGWHCDQMFFDEFLDDGMDAKGMEDLIEIIRTYSERKDTGIIVVSHKAKSECFARNWYVSKNADGFSNVAIKE